MRISIAQEGRDAAALARLGRLLADARGYRVLASDGRQVGIVDHVRYERHSDHPDQVVVRRRRAISRRLRAVPFDEVGAVDPSERTVVLRTNPAAIDRLPAL